MNKPHIMSEKELSNYLGISYWTLRTFRLKHKLPYFRTERHIFYCIEDVMEWIHAQEKDNMSSQKSKEYVLD